MDHTQPLCRRIMYGMVGELVQIHRINLAVDIGKEVVVYCRGKIEYVQVCP